MTLNEGRHAVGYVRLSRARGDDSITTQLEDVTALADRRGLGELARIYQDDVSAAELNGRQSKHRPGFAALMEDVRRGLVSHVLVRDTGRLFRGRRERASVYEAFAAHRVNLWCVRGPDLDLSSPSGRLVANVLGELNAWEVEEQSTRTQRALQRRREQGIPASAGRCFGFTKDGLELVEAEAAAVRAAFTSWLAGSSLTGVARQLNATGLKTRGGKAHTAGTTRHMLRNLRYAAVREDADGKVWPLISPRVVDEDTVRAARARLARPERRTSPGPASRWVLSSVGRCGVDGCAHPVTSGSRGGKGGAGPTPIYRCAGPVKHLARAAEPIDAYLRRLVAAVVERDAAELLAADVDDPAVTAARDEVERCRRKLDRLAEAFADADDEDADAASDYRDARKAVSGRLKAAQAVLDRSHQDSALGGVADADDVHAAVHALPLDRFRTVLATITESVTLLPAARLAKTRGFLPESVDVRLANGKPLPDLPPVAVGTLDAMTEAALREALAAGGWVMPKQRGQVPAEAADAARQWLADWAQGFTYDFPQDHRVAAAVRSLAAAAPLTADQKQAVRAALVR